MKFEFKESKIYNEIVNSDKTFSVPYHIKSGVIINENNIDYIIEIELNKSKDKLESLSDKAYIFNNIEEKIINQYRNSIGKPYLLLEFAYLNKTNIDSCYDIEKLDNFYEWLVE